MVRTFRTPRKTTGVVTAIPSVKKAPPKRKGQLPTKLKDMGKGSEKQITPISDDDIKSFSDDEVQFMEYIQRQNLLPLPSPINVRQESKDNLDEREAKYEDDNLSKFIENINIDTITDNQFVENMNPEQIESKLNDSNEELMIYLMNKFVASELSLSENYVLKQNRETRNVSGTAGCKDKDTCFNKGHLLLTFDNVPIQFKQMLFQEIKSLTEKVYNKDTKRKVAITCCHEVGHSTDHPHPHVHLAITLWPNEANWHYHGTNYWDVEWIIDGGLYNFHPNIKFIPKIQAYIDHIYCLKEDQDPIQYNYFPELEEKVNGRNTPNQQVNKKVLRDVS